MIINKITNGFVVQKWDSEKNKWIAQEFIAGDGVDYEDEKGWPTSLLFLGDEEPYLPFDMVQPMTECTCAFCDEKFEAVQGTITCPQCADK